MGEIGSLLGGVGGLFVGLAAIAGGLVTIGAKIAKLWVKIHNITDALRALWKSRLTAVALTSILFGASLFVARALIPPPCSPTSLSITSPRDGTVVNQSQPVLGTINHLCPGQHLWLVLQPGGAGGGGYYPQNKVAVASNAERWSTATYFGRQSNSDDGRPYTLLAVVADNPTNQQFQAYLTHGGVTHNFPGLADLGGAAVLSQIKVIRGRYLPP
ncbi:MAG: hypothetical protein ABSA53_38285 [Streptosporangiaceae bacterium]|jgi:hypothetical protein